jgi:hypothetical protein
MYRHITQFETRDMAFRDALRLDTERRAARRLREIEKPKGIRPSRLRALAATLLRPS